MFSRAYASLVLESGISRLFSSFRFLSLISEAKSNEDFANFVGSKLREIATRNARKLPGLAQAVESEEVLKQVLDAMVRFNEDQKAREGRNSAAINEFLIGGPNNPGQLALLLNKDPNSVISNFDTIYDFWVHLGDNLKAAKLSGNNEIPIAGTIDKGIFDRIKSLSLDDMSQINSWMASNVSAQLTEKASDKFRGTEVLMEKGNNIILKFPQGNNKDTIETLKDVGEMKPENVEGGVCTRRNFPGGSRAEHYLQNNTVYVGLKKSSVGYKMDFQGVYNANAEQMDPMNRPYGPLKGEAFTAVLKDIASRAASQLKMDPEEIIQIVMDAKKKSEDEIIDQ